MTVVCGSNMTINEARLIAAISEGTCSRALAEIFYPAEHPFHGNQIAGSDLRKEAAAMLGNFDLDAEEFFFNWDRTAASIDAIDFTNYMDYSHDK